jgi:hypothetical protein
MITRIVYVCEDAHQEGFLNGLKSRLECRAEALRFRSRGTHLRRQDAQDAWEFALEQGAQLVVHLVDADEGNWRQVRKNELDKYPPESHSQLVCGVADATIEDWLCLDRRFFKERFGLPAEEFLPPKTKDRADVLKGAMRRVRKSGQRPADVVLRLVESLPAEVLREWRKDRSLEAFFTDCVNAARRADCPVRTQSESTSEGVCRGEDQDDVPA